jgi:PAS domain S-box-containing protein
MLLSNLAYTIPVLAAAAIAAVAALYAIYRFSAVLSPFIFMMVSIAVWCAAYALEVASPDLGSKILWGKIKYLGVVLAPWLWLVLTAVYTGRDRWLTRRHMMILAIMPVITLLLVWTNPFHGLMWSRFGLHTAGALTLKISTHGPWFWINLSYSYLLMIAGAWMILQRLVRFRGPHGGQSLLILVSLLAPWTGNILYVSRLSPLRYLDLTPFGFTISGLCIAWVTFHARLLNILPVAREVLVESMSDGVIVLDAKDCVAEINPAARTWIGSLASTAIGRPVREIFPQWPDDLGTQGIACSWQKDLILDTGGSGRIIDFRISPLLDRRKGVIGRVGVMRDVTDQKGVEASLKQAHSQMEQRIEERTDELVRANERLEQEIRERERTDKALREASDIISKSPAVAFLWKHEPHWPVQFVTDNVESLFGYSAREFTSGSITYEQVIHGDDLERVSAEVLRFSSDAGVTRFAHKPYRIVCKDGTVKWVEDRTHIRRGPEGTITHYQGIVEDFTERIRMEEDLRASEEKFRSAFEHTGIGMAIVGLTGDLIQVNAYFCQMLGYAEPELMSLNVKAITHREDLDFEIQEHRRLIKGEIPTLVLEKRYLDKAGRVVWGLVSSSVVRDAAETPLYLVAHIQDITQRKQIEEERKRLQSQLHHAQKMESIGIIASGVAHNFRNILTGISANSHILQMHCQDDGHLRAVSERINSVVSKGAHLVDGLMQFSRRDRTEGNEVLNMSQVIHDSYDLIRKSFDQKIDVQIDCADYLPVMGDHSGLSQVIMNLCINARDAMPRGGRLTIQAREEDQRLRIVVADTGDGMEKRTLEKCFDPFFTTKGDGTGLGLSTAYGIVREHGGEIHAYSELEKGTTFRIDLPLESDREVKDRDLGWDFVPGDGQKVLVVDDETDVREPMQAVLEGMGYRVALANCGEEALEKFDSWRPDVVLMDRNMPGMDGISCSLKIMEKDPHAKILLVSGYEETGPNGIDARTKEVIVDYLTKPINMADLSRSLHRVFSD